MLSVNPFIVLCICIIYYVLYYVYICIYIYYVYICVLYVLYYVLYIIGEYFQERCLFKRKIWFFLAVAQNLKPAVIWDFTG